METGGYTIRGVITAVRWKETTLVTTGCIWKCKALPASRSETQVSSASNSYHDAVQRASNSSHQPPPQLLACAGVNVGVFFNSLEVIRWEVKVLLAFLIIYLPYINEQCFIMSVLIVCSHMCFSFVKVKCWVWIWNPHCRWKNSPNAVSVQLYEQHTVDERIPLMQCLYNCMNSTL